MSTHTMPCAGAKVPAVSALKTVVVATDFSKSSSDALDWAVDVAAKHAAKLLVVHAIDTPLTWMGELEGPIGRVVNSNLEALERVVEAKHVVVQTEFATGRPWDVISRIAGEAHADLIVVGAHAHSTVAQKLIGTTADRLTRMSTIPVLVHRGVAAEHPQKIETILAATDFSAESLRAVAAGLKFFGDPLAQQRVVLMHAVPIPLLYVDIDIPVPTADYWKETETVAMSQMNDIARQLHRPNLLIDTRTHREDPAHAILREAKDIHADLITIGTVGRAGVDRFFMGSVAETVLHHAACPVLTAHLPRTGSVGFGECAAEGRR